MLRWKVLLFVSTAEPTWRSTNRTATYLWGSPDCLHHAKCLTMHEHLRATVFRNCKIHGEESHKLMQSWVHSTPTNEDISWRTVSILEHSMLIPLTPETAIRFVCNPSFRCSRCSFYLGSSFTSGRYPTGSLSPNLSYFQGRHEEARRLLGLRETVSKLKINQNYYPKLRTIRR